MGEGSSAFFDRLTARPGMAARGPVAWRRSRGAVFGARIQSRLVPHRRCGGAIDGGIYEHRSSRLNRRGALGCGQQAGEKTGNGEVSDWIGKIVVVDVA